MNDQSKQYQQLIAKSWADEDFKNQLLADPVTVLKAEGMELPEGVTVNAVEDSAQSLTLVIPAKPESLSDNDLGDVSGGRVCAGGMCVLTCF